MIKQSSSSSSSARHLEKTFSPSSKQNTKKTSVEKLAKHETSTLHETLCERERAATRGGKFEIELQKMVKSVGFFQGASERARGRKVGGCYKSIKLLSTSLPPSLLHETFSFSTLGRNVFKLEMKKFCSLCREGEERDRRNENGSAKNAQKKHLIIRFALWMPKRDIYIIWTFQITTRRFTWAAGGRLAVVNVCGMRQRFAERERGKCQVEKR